MQHCAELHAVDCGKSEFRNINGNSSGASVNIAVITRAG